MVVKVSADTRKLRAQISATQRLFGKTQDEVLYLAEYFLDRIRSLTPRDTGQTADAWVMRFTAFGKVSGEGLIWEIRNEGREEIVEYLEFGTRPHVIEPRDPGGVLAFEVGGETVFAKKVFHPGTKPLGFVRMTQRDIDQSTEGLARKLSVGIAAVWGS